MAGDMRSNYGYQLLPTDAPTGGVADTSITVVTAADGEEVKKGKPKLANPYSVAATRRDWSLHPDLAFFDLWNIMVLFTIFVSVIIVPFRWAFRRLVRRTMSGRILDTLDQAGLVIFLLDTLMQFLIQVPAANDCGMVTKLPTIGRLYIQRGLFLDLVSMIPWDFIYAFTQVYLEGCVEQSEIVHVVFFVLALSRLARLGSVQRLTSRWIAVVRVNHLTKTITSCVMSLCLTLHLMACVWSLVPLVSPPGRPNWLLNYWPNRPREDYTVVILYTTSYYWAIVTTTSVGFGDICPSPTNTTEQVIVIVAIIVAAARWSIVIANVVDVVQDTTAKSMEFEKTMDTCERIIHLQHLNGPISKKIREYFIKFYELEKEKGTRRLVDRMSPMLQREVVSEAYAAWIEDVPWIAAIAESCLVRVILVMQNNLYVPKEDIPDARQCCFVQRGILLIGGKILRKGDSWGVDMTLHGHWRQHVTGSTKTFASTLVLAHHHLERVLCDHPEDEWKVRRVSSHLAFRRQIKHLAGRVLATGKFISLIEAVDTHKLQVIARATATNRDDVAYLVKLIKDSNRSTKNRQGSMDNRIGSLETRIGGLEDGLVQMIQILQNASTRVANGAHVEGDQTQTMTPDRFHTEPTRKGSTTEARASTTRSTHGKK